MVPDSPPPRSWAAYARDLTVLALVVVVALSFTFN